MCKKLMYAVAVAAMYLLNSCGVMPTSIDEQEYCSLNLSARISQSSALAKIAQTTWDSLVVRITASDMTPIRKSSPASSSIGIVALTLPNIPAGSNRMIEAWTIDKTGRMVHKAESVTRNFAPNEVVTVALALTPACGSLYLQIADVPTSVDSVFAKFECASTGESWQARVARLAKLSISLDKIPDRTQGVLTVQAVDTAGATLYSANPVTLTFHADSLQTVPLAFTTTPSAFSLALNLQQPGATVGMGSMAGSVDTSESGALIITELMYMANDSEYVEIYNPSSSDTTISRMVLDIDGDTLLFSSLTVPAKDHLVIGRKKLAWTDVANAKLDLSSTNGNWVTLKSSDGKIIDRVAFAVKVNGLEWPNISSGKKSICLDSLAYGAEDNNFGRNWHVAESAIDPATIQYGTPGRMGK